VAQLAISWTQLPQKLIAGCGTGFPICLQMTSTFSALVLRRNTDSTGVFHFFIFSPPFLVGLRLQKAAISDKSKATVVV